MYAYFRLIRNSSLFGLFCLASLAQASENSIWTIDSRSLPTPAAASGALSSTLANLPAPNIAISSQYPASDIEWRAFIDAANAARLVPLELLEQTYKVNIEKSEIGGVRVYEVTAAQISPDHQDRLFFVHSFSFLMSNFRSNVRLLQL